MYILHVKTVNVQVVRVYTGGSTPILLILLQEFWQVKIKAWSQILLLENLQKTDKWKQKKIRPLNKRWTNYFIWKAFQVNLETVSSLEIMTLLPINRIISGISSQAKQLRLPEQLHVYTPLLQQLLPVCRLRSHAEVKLWLTEVWLQETHSAVP